METRIDNFYLASEVIDSPSTSDGVDLKTCSTLRHFGAELIQNACILLGCQQVRSLLMHGSSYLTQIQPSHHQSVAVTGQVLLQRFYCKRSLREYNVRRLAAACTFLSSKLEEDPRRLRDVILVFDRIFKRQEGPRASLVVLEPGSREYHSAKDVIIRYERELLRAFGFILHAEHPHNFVINYCHMLCQGEAASDLTQMAWSTLNDSLRTPLCVRFKAEVVACGAIFYSARKLKIPLPESSTDPWWVIFECKTDQLVEVVNVLHELYSRTAPAYIDLPRNYPTHIDG